MGGRSTVMWTTNKMKQRGQEQSVNPRQYLLRHYSACRNTVISTAVSDVSESTTRNFLTTANKTCNIFWEGERAV